MEIKEKEDIKEAVRKTYGNVARIDSIAASVDQAAACCDTSCCGSQPISPEQLSAVMGYSNEEMASVPEGANLGLGCGNPLAVASLKEGETVVDLGSGGGFDCFLAAREVGKTGQVIGVDMTPDMISKALKNAEKAGIPHVEFRLGEIEHLPVADQTADIIMSNCVINLSPDKRSVYHEAFRILKPGGRLSISDIVATAQLPDDAVKDLALVSACIGGAATIDDTVDMLGEAGFEEIKITAKDESRALIREWVPDSDAGDYVVSAVIEARRPMT